MHTYILSPEQEQQVSWNTTSCQTVKACRDAATPQVHHGGSSWIQRGKASHQQTPLSNPVIWEYPVINELDRNGSPRFKVCWLKWRREFQSEHRGGSSCDHCSMRVSVCVWVLHRPDYTCPVHNNTTTAQHLHSCTGGPTGLNGRGSIQTLWGPRHSKSGGTEQEEGEGAHFPPKEHQSLKKTSFFKNIFYSQLSPSAF